MSNIFFILKRVLGCTWGIITLISLNNVQGATILVGPPPASIQVAINSAAVGDTVQLRIIND